MKIRAIALAVLFSSSVFHCCPASAIGDSSLLPSVVMVTNYAQTLFDRPLPGKSTMTISTKDKIALFYVVLRSTGSSQQRHEIRLECVDEKGEEVLSKSVQQDIPSISFKRYLDGQSGYFEEFLGLDPSPNALVNGQRKKLETGQNYYFRLFIDGKLSALTSFRYDQ